MSQESAVNYSLLRNLCSSLFPKLEPQGHPLTALACCRQLFGISVPGTIFHTVWIIKCRAGAKQCGDRPVIHSSVGMHALEIAAPCLSDHLSPAIDNLQWKSFSIYSFCCHCSFLPPLIPPSSSFSSVSSGDGAPGLNQLSADTTLHFIFCQPEEEAGGKILVHKTQGGSSSYFYPLQWGKGVLGASCDS